MAAQHRIYNNIEYTYYIYSLSFLYFLLLSFNVFIFHFIVFYLFIYYLSPGKTVLVQKDYNTLN